MFKRKKKFRIDTFIDKDMIIRGNVKFSGGVRLDGKIYGDLNVEFSEKSGVVMGSEGMIKGDISGNHIIINGKVTGSIKALDYLEINSNAIIEGDIEYDVIEIHAGAVILGSLKKLNKREIGKILKDDQNK